MENPKTLTGAIDVPVADLINVFRGFKALDVYDLRIGFIPRLRLQGLNDARTALAIIELPVTAQQAGPVVLGYEAAYSKRDYRYPAEEIYAWLASRRRVRVRVEVRRDALVLVDGADRYEVKGSDGDWIPEPNISYMTRVSTTLRSLARAPADCDAVFAVKHGEFYMALAADCGNRRVRVPIISVTGEDVEVMANGPLWHTFLRAFSWADGKWDVYLAVEKPIKAVYRAQRLSITYYQAPIIP
jgi:hypothetical protein|nr:MAG: hypothetical protein TU35_08960 [Thermoproteus sp. AZ2]